MLTGIFLIEEDKTMNSQSTKLSELRRANENSDARKRLTYLFDDGSFTELNAFTKENDNLSGVVTAYGFVEGNPVYAFSQDKNIKGGAVGKAHAKKIAKVYELAAKTGAPVVGIHDSNGAFIDGGADALSAYGDMLKWTSNISGVVPQISVIAGTCAGSAAMIACSSDFVIMSKDAELFMAPPFDKDAGTAESAAKSGTASIVCDDDKSAVETARKLVSILPANNLSPVPLFEFDEPATAFSTDAEKAVASIADADSIIEISKDFGLAAYTAFGSVQGATVGFAATNKTSQKLNADDCAKLARFVRTCDAFSIPVVTLIDSEGFESGSAAEIAGSIRNMTMLASAYAEATTVKVSVITGKAYGPVFVALSGKNSNSDMIFALADAVITPLAPETAVEFLSHDKLKGAESAAAKRKELADEYIANEASAITAAEKNAVDDVIEPAELRARIISALDVLSGKRVTRLSKKHSNMPL